MPRSTPKHAHLTRRRLLVGQSSMLVAGCVLAMVLSGCNASSPVAGRTGSSTSTLSGSSGSSSTTTASPSSGSTTTAPSETTTPSTATSSSSGAAVPGWIRPGLVLGYITDEDSGYVAIRDTTTVESVSHGVVSGETHALAVGTDKTYDWTCTADGSCPDGEAAFQFWIDPKEPLGSVKGQGLPYQYLGTDSLYDPENRQTYTVGILHYSNASGSVRNSTFFDSTGLVIEADAVIGRLVTQVWYYDTVSG
jgi:hypothetical protein